MKILIAGAGKVGSTVARQLASEGHDLTLIDSKQEVLERSLERFDVMAVRGNCAVLCAGTADIGGVVRIKIHKDATLFQNPIPLLIGFDRFRQRPGQIAAEYHVKAFILKIQCLSVHFQKINIQVQGFCQRMGFY